MFKFKCEKCKIDCNISPNPTEEKLQSIKITCPFCRNSIRDIEVNVRDYKITKNWNTIDKLLIEMYNK